MNSKLSVMSFLICMAVISMTVSSFAQIDPWEKFNASVVIEVTRFGGVFTCSGVAVSDKIIITAAHCLEGRVKKIRVFTQEKYDPDQDFLEIEDFELHPEYHPEVSLYQSDIAKIHLKKKLPESIRIHSIYEGRKIYGELYRFGFGERNGTNIRTIIRPNLKRLNPLEKILELNDEFSMSGDSGGPVFMIYDQKISILAIHSTFSHGPQGNYSLNPILGDYVPWIFNQ